MQFLVFLVIATLSLLAAFRFDGALSSSKSNVFSQSLNKNNRLNLFEDSTQRRLSRQVALDMSGETIPKIIIAGAPASGKGTQCEVIKKNFGVVHLSTGDILRAAVNEKTPLGTHVA